jgi:hypothetical protein
MPIRSAPGATERLLGPNGQAPPAMSTRRPWWPMIWECRVARGDALAVTPARIERATHYSRVLFISGGHIYTP